MVLPLCIKLIHGPAGRVGENGIIALQARCLALRERHLFTQDLIQRRKEPLHLLGCANRDAQIVRDARRVEVAD